MASDRVIEIKKEVVNEIKKKIEESATLILIDYRGLSVSEITDLRRKLRDNNSDIKIYKNTLTKRALDQLKIDLDEKYMEGPNALAYSSEVVEPLKVLSEFGKKHKALEIRIGLIDGNIKGKDELMEIAKIPSREGLLNMLAGGMIGVVKNLSVGLNMVAEQKENNVGGK